MQNSANEGKELGVTLSSIAGFLLVFFGIPVGFIYSCNTLFSANIPYSFSSWSAALILYFVILLTSFILANMLRNSIAEAAKGSEEDI